MHFYDDLLVYLLDVAVDLLNVRVLPGELLLELLLDADEVFTHGFHFLLVGRAARWILEGLRQEAQHLVQGFELLIHGVHKREDQRFPRVDDVVLQLVDEVLDFLLVEDDATMVTLCRERPCGLVADIISVRDVGA